MVNSPTRGKNILGLFATNRPGLIQKVEVTPGLSDHKVITIELLNLDLEQLSCDTRLTYSLLIKASNVFHLSLYLPTPIQVCGIFLKMNVTNV